METNYLVIMALLIGCLATTIPVFMALFFTGMVGLVWIAGIDPQIVIEVLYRSMDKFALIVVLFFVLCGNIMTTGIVTIPLMKKSGFPSHVAAAVEALISGEADEDALDTLHDAFLNALLDSEPESSVAFDSGAAGGGEAGGGEVRGRLPRMGDRHGPGAAETLDGIIRGERLGGGGQRALGCYGWATRRPRHRIDRGLSGPRRVRRGPGLAPARGQGRSPGL